MDASPAPKRRRSVRLPEYDYGRAGAYFVTVVTRQRECLFGRVVDGQMELNTIGGMVRACYIELPHHFVRVSLDAYVIMPNHCHEHIVRNDDDLNRIRTYVHGNPAKWVFDEPYAVR